MIAPSEFDDIIAAGLEPVVLSLQETFNGENARPTYLFRQFLGKRYSIDGSWKSLGIDNGLIAADVIALDSPLPVKLRPSISQASGQIPKLGTELPMNESELKQLRLLKRAGGDLAQISTLIFQDTRRVYGGVLEQIESQFLEGLSNGFFVRDTLNVGLGVRADFGYLTGNQFNASVVWGNTGYTPISDIVSVLDKADADGVAITRILLDRATLNQILISDEAKALFSNYNRSLNAGSRITLSQLNEAMGDSYSGIVFEEINRSVTYEVNGVKTTVKPWATGQLIFLSSDQVGSLVWSDVEEMEAPVGGVNYARAEDFILISQYRTVRPSLKQWTAAQAVALPVINGFNIYKLDSTQTATT